MGRKYELLPNGGPDNILSGYENQIDSLISYERKEKHFLVSASHDFYTKIWNLKTHACVKKLKNDYSLRSLILFHRYNNVYIVSGDVEAIVKIWSLEDYSEEQILMTDDHDVKSLVMINNEDMLAVALNDGTIMLQNLQDKNNKKILEGHLCRVQSLHEMKFGIQSYLLSTSDSNDINIWGIQN